MFARSAATPGRIAISDLLIKGTSDGLTDGPADGSDVEEPDPLGLPSPSCATHVLVGPSAESHWDEAQSIKRRAKSEGFYCYNSGHSNGFIE